MNQLVILAIVIVSAIIIVKLAVSFLKTMARAVVISLIVVAGLTYLAVYGYHAVMTQPGAFSAQLQSITTFLPQAIDLVHRLI